MDLFIQSFTNKQKNTFPLQFFEILVIFSIKDRIRKKGLRTGGKSGYYSYKGKITYVYHVLVIQDDIYDIMIIQWTLIWQFEFISDDIDPRLGRTQQGMCIRITWGSITRLTDFYINNKCFGFNAPC